jgi:Flp pilus assembly protein TadB
VGDEQPQRTVAEAERSPSEQGETDEPKSGSRVTSLIIVIVGTFLILGVIVSGLFFLFTWGRSAARKAEEEAAQLAAREEERQRALMPQRISVTCPTCEKQLAVPAQYAGMEGLCNNCQGAVPVPVLQPAAPGRVAGPGIPAHLDYLTNVVIDPDRPLPEHFFVEEDPNEWRTGHVASARSSGRRSSAGSSGGHSAAAGCVAMLVCVVIAGPLAPLLYVLVVGPILNARSRD